MKMKRIVIKVGTSLLANGRHFELGRMMRLVKELSDLQKRGLDVVLVSSGAIAAGMGELHWAKRPSELSKKQAAAAVGQPRLMETYRKLFHRHGLNVAQVLLTKEDFDSPKRRHNIRVTIEAIFHERLIPIINENDTVAVEEIRLGDNDTLAAHVAVNIKADLAVLLTDVDGLMTRPPHHGHGDLIPIVSKIDHHIELLAHGSPGSDGGTGGMMTKIRAAKLSTEKGVPMVIASGLKAGVLQKLTDNQPEGTLFLA